MQSDGHQDRLARGSASRDQKGPTLAVAALWGWNIAHANDDRLLTLTVLCRSQPMDCLPMVSVGRQVLLRSGKVLGPCQALERIATDSRRSSFIVGLVLKHNPARAHCVRCTGIHLVHTCPTELISRSLPIVHHYACFLHSAINKSHSPKPVTPAVHRNAG